MTPAVRVISINQTDSYWGLSLNEIRYMEDLLDEVPFAISSLKHHHLIKKSFIHTQPTPPFFAGRFKPPAINLNVLYASKHIRTAVHEAVFYFLKERVNNHFSSTPEKKMAIGLLLDTRNFHDLTNHPNISNIMSKNNYADSHNYYLSHPAVEGIMYPSCRLNSPHNLNFAVMDIMRIDPGIHNIDNLEFSFIFPDRCKVTNVSHRINVTIDWQMVS